MIRSSADQNVARVGHIGVPLLLCDIPLSPVPLAARAQTNPDLSWPPVVQGAAVVATFHTHPNPSAEGWQSGPSAADTQSAWLFGVLCLIRADDGTHTTGPASRRGGLTGDPGYPP